MSIIKNLLNKNESLTGSEIRELDYYIQSKAKSHPFIVTDLTVNQQQEYVLHFIYDNSDKCFNLDVILSTVKEAPYITLDALKSRADRYLNKMVLMNKFFKEL